MSSRNIKKVVADNRGKNIADFSDDGKILIEFLNLVVDIKYRHRYGTSVANSSEGNYSEITQSKDALTGQVTPVDDGLSGHSRRELFGL